MSTGDRIPLHEAQMLAQAFLADLAYPGLIDIAGSLRRRRPTVGDLEFVADSGEESLAPDLPTLDACLERALASGLVQPRFNAQGMRAGWGERLKKLVYRGVPVDLWIVRPDRNYATTLLIRTGPGDANQALVTHTQRGGLLPDHLMFYEGNLWRTYFPVTNGLDQLPPGSELVRGSEADLFQVMHMAYVPPSERTVADYRDARLAWRPLPLVGPFERSITLATARIDVDDYQRADITIDALEKHRATRTTALFAPPRSLVSAYQRQRTPSAEQAYTSAYLDLLRWRYAAYKQDYVNLLDAGRLVFVCFCKAGEFCHRHLAVEVLAKIARAHGVEVILEGELPAVDPAGPIQPALFDLPATRQQYD